MKKYKYVPLFYGQVLRKAEEICLHTKNVNSYYFGEIRIDADNEGFIFECRKSGFVVYFYRSKEIVLVVEGERKTRRYLLKTEDWFEIE